MSKNGYYITLTALELITILNAATGEKVKKITINETKIYPDTKTCIEIEIDRNHIREREKTEKQ